MPRNKGQIRPEEFEYYRWLLVHENMTPESANRYVGQARLLVASGHEMEPYKFLAERPGTSMHLPRSAIRAWYRYKGYGEPDLGKRKGSRFKVPLYCTPEQCRQALVLMEQKFGLRDAMSCRLAYHCGLRRSEVRNLLVRHVNLAGQSIRVLDSKHGGHRNVPILDAKFRMLLKRWIVFEKQLQPDDRVIDLVPQGLPQKVLRVFEQMGLHDIHSKPFHYFRHMYGTHLWEAGYQLEQIQVVMGHEQLETTRMYVQIAGIRAGGPGPDRESMNEVRDEQA